MTLERHGHGRRAFAFLYTFVAAFFVPVLGRSGEHEAMADTPPLRSQLIFPPQEKHVHSSSIVTCPNGDLLACWYRGSGERRANDVLIQGSRKRIGSNQWEPPFLMADVPDFPDCNPVLFIDPQRQLWLFWPVILDSQWSSAITRVRTSIDYMGDGPPKWKWQDDLLFQPHVEFAADIDAAIDRTVAALPADFPDREAVVAHLERRRSQLDVPLSLRLGWMPRHYPVMVDETRMLVPLYSNTWGCGLVAITDDRGEHWMASRPIAGIAASQPAIVHKRDGTLVAYLRDNSAIHRVHVASSSDRGMTWTVPVPTDLRNPGSSVEAITLRSGCWVIVYNDTEAERYQLAVQVSRDEGVTWSAPRYLDRAGPTDRRAYHYASLMETDDGLLHVTYSWRGPEGESIKYVVFDEAWIEGR